MLIKLLILTGDNQIEQNKILSLSIGILSPLIKIKELASGCSIFIILESVLTLSI